MPQEAVGIFLVLKIRGWSAVRLLYFLRSKVARTFKPVGFRIKWHGFCRIICRAFYRIICHYASLSAFWALVR